MSSVATACPQCQCSLPAEYCNSGTPARCPVCDATIQIEIFPALFKPSAAGTTAEAIVEEGISSCFYHEQNKAVVH